MGQNRLSGKLERQDTQSCPLLIKNRHGEPEYRPYRFGNFAIPAEKIERRHGNSALIKRQGRSDVAGLSSSTIRPRLMRLRDIILSNCGQQLLGGHPYRRSSIVIDPDPLDPEVINKTDLVIILSGKGKYLIFPGPQVEMLTSQARLGVKKSTVPGKILQIGSDHLKGVNDIMALMPNPVMLLLVKESLPGLFFTMGDKPGANGGENKQRQEKEQKPWPGVFGFDFLMVFHRAPPDSLPYPLT